MSDILLQTGEFYFGAGRVRVRTVLGSCVAITMWRADGPMGGMCHYLLPAAASGAQDPWRPVGMYAEEAVALFVRAIRAAKTRPDDYVVKVFGGGRMFESLRPARCDGVCVPPKQLSCTDVACKNILAARELLADHGFRVAAENVGGEGSRDLILDIWTGDVWLRRGERIPARRTA